jgi:hypothetical protein
MVDGACSFSLARAAGGRKSAKAMARFLEEDVLTVYREAKIRLVEGDPRSSAPKRPARPTRATSARI